MCSHKYYWCSYSLKYGTGTFCPVRDLMSTTVVLYMYAKSTCAYLLKSASQLVFAAVHT